MMDTTLAMGKQKGKLNALTLNDEAYFEAAIAADRRMNHRPKFSTLS